MLFRFFLQPTMAAIAAWRAGVNDARTGRTPFFEAILTGPAQRAGRVNEALVATARIILLGLVMDGVYQVIEFKYFHPAEAAIIALVLALSFGLYGLIRKTATLGALEGLALETLLLAPIAVPLLAWWTLRGSGAMAQGDLALDFWLLIGGPLTALPLLLFAAGARRTSVPRP